MNENAIGYEVMDATVRVHRELGPGLLESVYEVVLAKELECRGMRVEFPRDLAIPQLPRSSTSAKLTPVMRASLTAFLHGGLSPRQFTPISGANNSLQEQPP